MSLSPNQRWEIVEHKVHAYAHHPLVDVVEQEKRIDCIIGLVLLLTKRNIIFLQNFAKPEDIWFDITLFILNWKCKLTIRFILRTQMFYLFSLIYLIIRFTLLSVCYTLTLHDVFYMQDRRQCNSDTTSSHHELYIRSIYIKLSQHHRQRHGKWKKSVHAHISKTFALRSNKCYIF